MYLIKRGVCSIAIASVLLMSCANDNNAEGGSSETKSDINMSEVMAPPVLPTHVEGEEEIAKGQMLGEGQSLDAEGNVVDMEGNVVMPASEAQKNNVYEQPLQDKATKEELRFVKELLAINSEYIATALLGSEKASQSELMDVGVRLHGEHKMLNDITHTFLDITHSKVNEAKNIKAREITGAKGKVWDEAWVNKMIEFNKEFSAFLKSNKSVIKHHELQNIVLQYYEHINNEREVLKEALMNIDQY